MKACMSLGLVIRMVCDPIFMNTRLQVSANT